ncbi:MAG TPA: hypothetical protein VIL37_02230 [Natronosporangium sp.]
MPRLATTAAGAVLLLLTAAACSDSNDGPAAEVVDACNQYNNVVNQWAIDYGAEIGAVEAAVAAGDEDRRETSVQVVRELFTKTADSLRAHADNTSNQELADAMADAADGLVEIGSQIETYEDVTNAPEMMRSGQFAESGERVSAICAG